MWMVIHCLFPLTENGKVKRTKCFRTYARRHYMGSEALPSGCGLSVLLPHFNLTETTKPQHFCQGFDMFTSLYHAAT